MKTINYDALTFIRDRRIYPRCSFGKISKCRFDGKYYALKEFRVPKYLNGKKRKLDMLSEIKNEHLLTPKYWVKKGNEKNMYLCDYCEGENISILEEYSKPQKIILLKQAKEAILSMHDEEIIHADITIYNIMIENGIAKILDFDNCTYGGFTTKAMDSNDYVQEFIKTYGINPELDIHLFNILTLQIMNEWSFFSIKKHIFSKDFGVFSDPEAIKICNRLFSDNKTPNKDFLIDTIDETSFTL